MSDTNPRDTPQPPQAARQGRLGRPVVWVLGVALVLTAIGFALVYSRFAAPLAATDANAGHQAVDAAAFTGENSIPAADAPTNARGEPTAPPTGEAPNRNAPTVSAAGSNPAAGPATTREN